MVFFDNIDIVFFISLYCYNFCLSTYLNNIISLFYQYIMSQFSTYVNYIFFVLRLVQKHEQMKELYSLLRILTLLMNILFFAFITACHKVFILLFMTRISDVLSTWLIITLLNMIWSSFISLSNNYHALFYLLKFCDFINVFQYITYFVSYMVYSPSNKTAKITLCFIMTKLTVLD